MRMIWRATALAILGVGETWATYGGGMATSANAGQPMREYEPIGEESEVTPTYEPITYALPLLGAAAREQGYTLPLPFGIGVNTAYIDQGLDLGEVRLGVNELEPAPSGVTFGESRDRTIAGIVRADAWLLPFLNVYVMGGTLGGEADLLINVPALTLDDPLLGPIPISDAFSLDLNLDYKGYQYGAGTTFAFGYKSVFFALDANYSIARLNIVDDPVPAVSASPRVGMLVETKHLPGSGALYLGGMFINFDMTMAGSIPLRTLDPALPNETLNYEVDAKPAQPWNFVMGGSWEIDQRWNVLAELGLGERKQLIVGGMFRF